MSSYPVWEFSMLVNPRTGMHKRWTHYSDGSVVESYFPGSAPTLFRPLIAW